MLLRMMLKRLVMAAGLCAGSALSIGAPPGVVDKESFEFLTACSWAYATYFNVHFENINAKNCMYPKLEISKKLNLIKEDGIVVNTALRNEILVGKGSGDVTIRVYSKNNQIVTWQKVNTPGKSIISYASVSGGKPVKLSDPAFEYLYSCMVAFSEFNSRLIWQGGPYDVRSCSDKRLKLMSDYGYGSSRLQKANFRSEARFLSTDKGLRMGINVQSSSGEWISVTQINEELAFAPPLIRWGKYQF